MKAIIALVAFGTFFFYSSVAFAAINFTIANPTISVNDEIELDASISGLISSSCSTSGCYLQGELRILDETKGFFGFTFNNSGEFVDYFSSASSTDELKTKLFNFVPASGAWSGKLKIKNNPENSNYVGPGQYTIRFRRFSGNSTSATSGDSNSLAIAFTLPTPTPTPTSTPEPTPQSTQTPTPTPKATTTPKPSTIATALSTLSAASLNSKSAQLTSSESSTIPSLLPTQKPTLSHSSRTEVLGTSKNDSLLYIIGAGAIFLITAGLFFFKGKIRNLIPF